LWIEHHAGNKHSLDENIQPKVSKPSGGDISEYQTKMFDRLCNNPGRSKDHELLNPENFLDMLFLQIFLSLSKR